MGSSSPLIVFDLDGVLIDSAAANVSAFRHGLEQVGVEVADPQTILSLVGYPATTMLARLGCPADQVTPIFENFVRPYYIEHLPALAKAYPGARGVLEQLKESGFRIGSCTSGDRKTQTQALQAIGLWEFIEHMQTPCDSEYGKPDARYLGELLAKFPEHGDLHHVEDSEVGIEMGLACRATTYFASYGNGQLSGAIEPHVILKSLKELPRAILRSVAS